MDGRVAPGEAVLLTRSCTTGWADWVHGELWLLADGLLRVRGSWAATLAAGVRMQSGRWETLAPGERVVAEHTHADVEAAAKRHRRNFWIPWSEIASARLHSGLTTARLLVTRADGSRVRLLWLKGDPATELLRPVLRSELGSKLVED